MRFPVAFRIFWCVFLLAFSQAAKSQTPPHPTPEAATKPMPQIDCSHPNFDFGAVDEGPDIHHEFKITNDGRANLIVTGVSTSCGCTAAVVKKAGAKDSDAATMPITLVPGKAAVVKATYHTSGRPGHATKIVTVSSNDPKNSNYALKLDMTVEREVETQPEALYLYNIKKGDPLQTAIRVLGRPGRPLKVLSAKSGTGAVTVAGLVSLKDPKNRRSGASIEVDLATQKVGKFSDTVTVKTNDPKKPELEVPVEGEILGNFRYEPSTLFVPIRADKPVTVAFTADNPKNFAVLKVESTKHFVRPNLLKVPGPSGTSRYLVAVLPAKNLPKDNDGQDQLVVNTNDGDTPKVTVDVRLAK